MRARAALRARFAGGLLFAAALLAAAPSGAQAAAPQPASAGRGAPSGAPPAVAACVGCHGPRGEGAGEFPRLGGLGAAYLRAQLEAFGNGSRKSAVMQPIAQALTASQRAEAAAFFASRGAPARAGRAEEAARSPADAGAWLATRGRWEVSVPACAQCHGPAGIGVGQHFPALAGQPAAYLAAQLKAWQAGERPPGPLGLMEAIARKLDDADIRAVSSYYAGLGTGAAGASRGNADRRAGASP